MAGVVGVIWGNREAVYFCSEDCTKPCVICPASNAIGSIRPNAAQRPLAKDIQKALMD
jgi:hypothetical protein